MILSGCSTTQYERVPEAHSDASKMIEELGGEISKLNPPPSLLIPCEPPKEFNTPELAELIVQVSELIGNSWDCYHKHNGLVLILDGQ